MLTNSTDAESIEEFILSVARSRGIFNLKAYSIGIVSDYQKFFNLVLPKDVCDIFVVLSISRDDISSIIKGDLNKVRPTASVTLMYSNKLKKDKIVIGYAKAIKNTESNAIDETDRNKLSSKLLEPLKLKIHPDLYSLGITY
ncbi:DUF4898 domain-containing protein [Sulfolobus tengchongensis]|uniref:DUF4898 domain-containing protein n=1 Tax=Sulfolobus tengchongensis TaxID=207809 RepID=A0AAX4L386_9CREN